MATTPSFQITLEGTFRENDDIDEITARLASLFRTDAATITRLLERAPTVIKRGLTEEDARKYQQVLERAGIRCSIKPEKTPPVESFTHRKVSPPIEQDIPPQENIRCPKCGFEQPAGRDDCLRCGVIFRKFEEQSSSENKQSESPRASLRRRSVEREETETDVEEEFTPEILHIEREGWISLGIGLVPAVLTLFFPFWMTVFRAFVTLVHEFGHTVVAWLFGYPTLPAFDFVYGGGMAIHFEREIGVLFVVYLLFAGLLYMYRENRLSLVMLVIMIALYTAFAFTPIHELLGLFMGHGMELAIAGLFLYRAISGSAIIVAAERPIYAFLGIFTEMSCVQFAYKLLTDRYFRFEYELGKGGELPNDFMRIAQDYLHVDLSSVVVFFLICCVIPPLAALLFFRYQMYLFPLLLRILRVNSESE